MASWGYPVGKAQQTILDALGIEENTFAHAEMAFAELGIQVRTKRVGRTSVPVVRVLPREECGFNTYGEGETERRYAPLTNAQQAALAPWMEA